MTNKSKKYHLLSLGCPKNQVDAECMASIMQEHGWKGVAQPEDADVIIVNTCGFIESAKKEAIDAILEMASFKEQRPATKLIVTGCLAQRYASDILTQMPEVDAVLGTADYIKIMQIVNELETQEKIIDVPSKAGSLAHLSVKRKHDATKGFAYLKIAEGCSHACAYCAIPKIRGKQISRPVADIVKEATEIAQCGISEIILIAQDTTSYGHDLVPQTDLLYLLKQLCQIEAVAKIRLMYIYAEGLNSTLLDFWQHEPKIVKYFDIPIQHASDKILGLMRRKDTAAGMLDVFSSIRKRMPEAVLRTTVMVGFPGETEADFEQLLEFVKQVNFNRLGCFVFSPEEGTAAFSMSPQVSASEAEARFWKLLEMQRDIDHAFNAQRIGENHHVVLEAVSTDGLGYLARTYGEAPDVDPPIKVYVSNENLSLGDCCEIMIVDLDDDQLIAVSKDKESNNELAQ